VGSQGVHYRKNHFGSVKKKMLHFSETEETLPDVKEVNDAFDP
jgi:hypothetical protein